MNNLLSNVLVIPNVITKEGLDYFLDYIKKSRNIETASIFDLNSSSSLENVNHKTEQKNRSALIITPHEIMGEIQDFLKNIVEEIVQPFYNTTIVDGEIPHFLVYNEGDHYLPHIDSKSLWQAPDGKVIFRKVADRDFSIILFLNDDFEGGYLTFPELKIKIQPEPGLLIIFPSNEKYVHGVEPVIKGTRYTLIDWLRSKDFLTVEEETQMIKEKYGVC